jgi:hypothetical protein
MRGPLRPRWWLLVLVVLLVVSGCSAPGGEAGGDAVDEPSGPTVQGEGEQPAASPEPAEPEAMPPGADAELEDGRHPVFLVLLDVPGGRVTFDLVQFFTGEEAIAAYQEDGQDDAGDPTPPNDYYIRNVNARLRTLPISAESTVTVVRLGEASGAGSVQSTLADLPRHLEETGPGPEGQLSWSPYWLTVEDGVVVALDEQYLP